MVRVMAFAVVEWGGKNDGEKVCMCVCEREIERGSV